MAREAASFFSRRSPAVGQFFSAFPGPSVPPRTTAPVFSLKAPVPAPSFYSRLPPCGPDRLQFFSQGSRGPVFIQDTPVASFISRLPTVLTPPSPFPPSRRYLPSLLRPNTLPALRIRHLQQRRRRHHLLRVPAMPPGAFRSYQGSHPVCPVLGGYLPSRSRWQRVHGL